MVFTHFWRIDKRVKWIFYRYTTKKSRIFYFYQTLWHVWFLLIRSQLPNITRVKEHIHLTKYLDQNMSAVAIHSLDTNPTNEFDKTKILASSSNESKMLESIEIKKLVNIFNPLIDSAFELRDTWRSVIGNLNSQWGKNLQR